MGIFQAKCDDKGRLKFPSEIVGYLKALDVERVFITTVDLKLIRIYSETLWERNQNVLAQGENIVPIPGTKRRTYLEENLGALKIELTARELDARAERWRPFRGYAVLHLWEAAVEQGRSATGRGRLT